jgi:hypothetical protein
MSRSGRILRLSLALVLAAPVTLQAQGDYVPDARASSDTLGPVRWGFSITPYVWSAGQKGRIGVDGSEADIDLSVGDVLDNISVGLAAVGEARRERGLGRLDFVYHSIGDDETAANQTVHASLDQVILQPEIGYTLLVRPWGGVDGLAGVRYWHTDAGIDVTEAGTQVASVSGSQGWVDGTVGARVRYGFHLAGAGWGGHRRRDLLYRARGLSAPGYGLRIGRLRVRRLPERANPRFRGPFLTEIPAGPRSSGSGAAGRRS